MSETRDLISEMQDGLAKNQLPDEEKFKMLCRLYEGAITGSPCPCGSAKTFGECCKLMWQSLYRGVDRAKQETRQGKKEKVKEKKREERDQKIDWKVKIGFSRGGTPAMDILSPDLQDPLVLARLLLMTYHDVMAQHFAAVRGALRRPSG